MTRLSLSYLGQCHVTLDGQPVGGFESNKVRALLAYLAVEADRPHQRDKLAWLLWPDRPDSDARANLRYALSNLRQAIGDRQATPPFLTITRQTIQFNCASDAWCDVTELCGRLQEPKAPSDDIELIGEAVALYGGSFLEGFSIGNSAPFDEWLLFKREQLQRLALRGLDQLALHHEARGAYQQALPHAWRQVELEPWREAAQRHLMRLLALCGRRGAALAQFAACRQALADELGVEPALETIRLYEQIRDGALAGPGAVTLDHGPPGETPAQALIPGRPRELPHTPHPMPALPPAGPHRSLRPTWLGAGLLGLVALAVILGRPLWGESLPPSAGIGNSLPGQPTADPDTARRYLKLCPGSPAQVCVSMAQGGQPTPLGAPFAFELVDEHLVWSPDGRQIVLGAGAADERGNPGYRLYLMDADGSGLRRLTDSNENEMAADWSPDGNWIAYHRSGQLWVIRPDGSDAELLFKPAEGKVAEAMVWAPDNERIGFALRSLNDPAAPRQIWVLHRPSATARPVYSIAESAPGIMLAWSPDGAELYCLLEGGSLRSGFILPADGRGEPKPVDAVPYSWFSDYWPRWGGPG